MLRGRSIKNFIALAIDILSIATISILGLFLRLGDEISELPIEFIISASLLFFVVMLSTNLFYNIHRGIWRYFGLSYFFKIVKSATIGSLIFLLFLFFITRLEDYPRSVLIINWLLLIIFISAPRALYRLYFDRSFKFIFRSNSTTATPVLLIGLGSNTEAFIREMARMNEPSYKIVGILDTKANLGRIIHDIPIRGTVDDLEKVMKQLDKKKLKPTRILIGSESYIGGKLTKLLKLSEKLSIPLSRLPKLTDFHNNVEQAPIQPIPIEDLLRRSQRTTDKVAMAKMIANKQVLVTGAGGTIGSELVRQIASFDPTEICILDISEFLLYEIEQEVKASFPKLKVITKLADIRDSKVIDNIFKNTKPEIVFHSAALKHVPLLESHKTEAILTNIIGTKNVLDSAIKYKAERFVQISTDKAVNPTSFMGATKRFAEMYCQSISSTQTKITIVRFGNVLGSNGSVVPIFEKQIAAGGPLTVTDPNVTRYFMTIREAVGLVIQAAVLNQDNKSKVFVLDMGEPIKVTDLAHHMIRLAGLKPEIDINIDFIGLRPGEKLHEDLFYEHEDLTDTDNKDIFLANPDKVDNKKISKSIDELSKHSKGLDAKKCTELLKKIVGSYK